MLEEDCFLNHHFPFKVMVALNALLSYPAVYAPKKPTTELHVQTLRPQSVGSGSTLAEATFKCSTLGVPELVESV